MEVQVIEKIQGRIDRTTGLKMKQQRGELIGYNGCLGYNYNKENKNNLQKNSDTCGICDSTKT